MIASRPDDLEPVDRAHHRFASYAVAAFCVLVIPVELGWVPYFQRAWGFTLWQYLPSPIAYLLALSLFVWCWRSPRTYTLRGLARLHEIWQRRSLRPLLWGALLGMPLLLWVLRERIYLGDSKILLFALAAKDTKFYFPDVGATFLMKSAFDLGRTLGVGGVAGLQVLICIAAIPALLCFLRVGAHLTPSKGWAAFATALMVLGGVTRIYAGHIEVYSIVLIGVGAYFWASLAYLRGNCSWSLPCLALGFGLWIHLCFLFLIPSLLVLPLIAEPSLALKPRLIQWTWGLTVTATPMIAFLLGLALAGHADDLVQAGVKLINWAEVGSGREHYETVWIRPWGEEESGTKYVLYSRLHLKFLANSFFLLAPAAVPVVLAYAAFSLRRFWSTPQAVFLSTATLPMLVYASIVRPVFGPYEWDLFTVTAVCLAALAAHLLAQPPHTTSLRHLCALLIGATLLLVTIPWVLVGIAAHRVAGPFAIDALHAAPDGSFYDAFVRDLAPWL